eukprot:ANDGO_03345.mRNA.1 hypothetical protein
MWSSLSSISGKVDVQLNEVYPTARRKCAAALLAYLDHLEDPGMYAGPESHLYLYDKVWESLGDLCKTVLDPLTPLMQDLGAVKETAMTAVQKALLANDVEKQQRGSVFLEDCSIVEDIAKALCLECNKRTEAWSTYLQTGVTYHTASLNAVFAFDNAVDAHAFPHHLQVIQEHCKYLAQNSTRVSAAVSTPSMKPLDAATPSRKPNPKIP